MLDNQINVCQTCLSTKAPQLPLREEILSNGFETVLIKSPEKKAENGTVKHKNDTIEPQKSKPPLNDEQWAQKIKRRQKRWKSAVTYEKYMNPDDKSLASQTVACSSMSSLSDSQTYDSIVGLEIKNEGPNIAQKSESHLSQSISQSFDDALAPHKTPRQSSQSVHSRSSMPQDRSIPDLTVHSHNTPNHHSLHSVKTDTMTKSIQDEAMSESNSFFSKKWYKASYRNPNDVSVTNESNKHNGPSKNKADIDIEADCTTTLLYMLDDACFGILSGQGGNEFLKTNVPKREHLNEDQIDQRRMYGAELDENKHIVAICGRGFISPSELYMALENDPIMARVSDRDGKLPLHAVCSKGMPLRSLPKFLFQNVNKHKRNTKSMMYAYDDNAFAYQNNGDNQAALEKELADQDSFKNSLQDIKEDAITLKDIVGIVLNAYEEGALMVDRNGDLPAHLLAKQLWEWEKHFKENYLNEHGREEKLDIFINRKQHKELKYLFREVSFIHRECIQSLLQPIHNIRSLCRAKGSKGILLPIHIAALYGVKFEIVQGMIEAYEEGVSLRCEDSLNGLRPILPLELLDRHKPKKKHIELAKTDTPKAKAKKMNSIDTFHRASDLMFMYFPNVTLYRNDPKRLRRIENMIRKEATDDQSDSLPAEVEAIWVWMNTFQMEESEENVNSEYDIPDYSQSVKNIVKELNLTAFSKLAKVQSPKHNTDLIEAAIPSCARVLQTHYDKLKKNDRNDVQGVKKSVLKQKGKYATESLPQEHTELAHKEKIDALIAQLCRFIFGIVQNSDEIPTNFIILPYKLKQNSEGGLELASKEDADIALKFAESLLGVNNTNVLSHILEKRFQSKNDPLETDDSWLEMEALVKQNVNALLSTYESGLGYMYLLDEFRGVPVVSYTGKYPFEVKNAAEIVRKILPLMQMGIVLMRGERGLSVLADVIMKSLKGTESQNREKELRKIVDEIQSLPIGYAHGKIADEPNIGASCDHLLSFGISLYSNSSRQSILWESEIEILKGLYSQYDSKRNYAGLKPIKSQSGAFLWTSKEMVGFSSPTLLISKENEEINVCTEPKADTALSQKQKAEEALQKFDSIDTFQKDNYDQDCSHSSESNMNQSKETFSKENPLYEINEDCAVEGSLNTGVPKDFQSEISRDISQMGGDMSTISSQFEQFSYSGVAQKDSMPSYDFSYQNTAAESVTKLSQNDHDKVENFRNAHTFSVCSDSHLTSETGFTKEQCFAPSSSSSKIPKLDSGLDTKFPQNQSLGGILSIPLNDTQDKVEDFRIAHTFSVCSGIVDSVLQGHPGKEDPPKNHFILSESTQIENNNEVDNASKNSLNQSKDSVESFRETNTFSVCEDFAGGDDETAISSILEEFKFSNSPKIVTETKQNHIYDSRMITDKNCDGEKTKVFEEQKIKSTELLNSVPCYARINTKDNSSIDSTIRGTTNFSEKCTQLKHETNSSTVQPSSPSLKEVLASISDERSKSLSDQCSKNSAKRNFCDEDIEKTRENNQVDLNADIEKIEDVEKTQTRKNDEIFSECKDSLSESNSSESTLESKENLLISKNNQIKELQQILTAFDEEERVLLAEKEQLIRFLEAELSKGGNTDRSTSTVVTDQGNQGYQSVASSVTNGIAHSVISEKKKNADTASSSTYTKDLSTITMSMNDSQKCRVQVLEKMLRSKDDEIHELQSTIKDRVADLQTGKDLKIADLLTCLSEKEEELKFYERALEECVSEYSM